MESLLLRLEAALGRLEAAAPLRTADQRLEAAVARLETLLGPSSGPPGSVAAAPAAPAAPPAAAAAAPGGSSGDAEVGPSVTAFRKVAEEYIPRIKKAAAEIGDSLELSVEQLEKAFAEEEKIVLAISKCKVCARARMQGRCQGLNSSSVRGQEGGVVC